MSAALGVDQLNVYPHPVAVALHASFERVADTQVPPDLLHVEGLALISKGGVARNDEAALQARQVGGEVFRETVREIVLRRVFAEVVERQHDDRQAGPRFSPASGPA